MAVYDHPSIARAELLGVETDNANGQAETMFVCDLVDGRSFEIDIDHTLVVVMLGTESARISSETAIRAASALLASASVVTERQS